MKKTSKLLLGVVLAIILFYNQFVGLNFSLIVLITAIILALTSPKTKKNKMFWILSTCVLLTSFVYAWFGDLFSFCATFSSIIVLGLYTQYPRFNFVLYPIIIGLNYFSFIIRVFFINEWLPPSKGDNQTMKKLIAWVLIPGIISLVFLGIYISGSSIFQDFFDRIRFDFDFWQIVFIVAVAFFFFFNYWFMFLPKELIKLNKNLKTKFSIENETQLKPSFSFLDLDFERKSGVITFIMLNILLLFFIIAYNYEQFFMKHSTGNLSEEIHNRVTTIIFSIVMAIIVIMFYFKSSFNFDKKAGILKTLANIWILLNTILICSAFLKNSEYILHYGLTYKRIGVYIFLILSLIGLFYTSLKLKNKETNLFLINRMSWVFYFAFVFCSLINFSWIVTKYNIVYNKNNDIEYLRNLDYNKQILFDTFHNDSNWNSYFENNLPDIERNKRASILSSNLYYYWLNWHKK